LTTTQDHTNTNISRFSANWITRLPLYLLTILTALLFAPAIKNLLSLWYTSSDYSHGFFVIPLSCYFVWLKRKELKKIEKKPLWLGLPFVCISATVYLIAYITRFHTLTYAAFVAVLLSLVLFLGGGTLTRKLLPPIFFLVFMFPIPSALYIQMTNPLKLFITNISSSIISLMGVPVYREGNLLFMSSTQLEVAEACSGIRSLYSYMMLGCVFAVMEKRWRSKILIIASTIPLALFINIVRVTGTGILANYFGARVAQGFFHEFSGILLFAVGFFLLLGEYALIRSKWDVFSDKHSSKRTRNSSTFCF